PPDLGLRLAHQLHQHVCDAQARRFDLDRNPDRRRRAPKSLGVAQARRRGGSRGAANRRIAQYGGRRGVAIAHRACSALILRSALAAHVPQIRTYGTRVSKDGGDRGAVSSGLMLRDASQRAITEGACDVILWRCDAPQHEADTQLESRPQTKTAGARALRRSVRQLGDLAVLGAAL